MKNAQPFEEDEQKFIQIGESKLVNVVNFFPRRKQSCADKAVGKVSEEPFETSIEFRNSNKYNNSSDACF